MKPTKIIVKKPIQALSTAPKKKVQQVKHPIQVQSSMARKIQRTFTPMKNSNGTFEFTNGAVSVTIQNIDSCGVRF